MDANPFTMVMTRMWELLLSHPQFVRDVKEGNRIRFDSMANRDPIKDVIGVADLPEVTIMADTLSANLQSTSSTSSVTRQYTVMVSTGDYRYNEILAQVEWCVFVALLSWRSKLTELEWKGKHFCKRMNVQSGVAGLSDPKMNRNIVGWSATWRVEVEMHFSTSDLLDELTQGEQ